MCGQLTRSNMQLRMVSSNKLFVALGTACLVSYGVSLPHCTMGLFSNAHSAADKFPKVPIVTAQVPPCTSGITVERAKAEL